MGRFIPRFGTILCQLSKEENERFFPLYQSFSAKINGFRKLIKKLVNPNRELVNYIEGIAEEFELKRYKVWEPILIQYGLPWRQGLYILPNYDGTLYNARDFVPKRLFNSYYKGEKTMKNVNENKPVDGTLVGKLTEEETKALMEIDANDAALQHINISVSTVQEFDSFLLRFQQLEKQRRTVLISIYKRLQFPQAWELSFDYSLGNIFVINYENPYEE
ncbi:MAG: hypothetical protein Q8936_19115 [Bacillota bacterium]|nr:hypothetical protein [Bacillota bacterium]